MELDEPPFFLESEFTEGGNLTDWATRQGGIDKVPLETRLELVARTARAAAAAHSVGIVHKDIKPANILIQEDEHGQPKPRLADFGIGTITDEAQLAQRNIPVSGFTVDVKLLRDESGSQMYAPPELLAGKPFTMLGDVYSLGVLLYQMVAGDLDRPLAQGWESDVRDPLLREDIAACVEGHEQQRLGSAQGLANRLESLPARRRSSRRRTVIRIAAAASTVLAMLLAVATTWGLREGALRDRAESEAEKATEILNFLQDMLASADPWRNRGPNAKVVDALDDAAADLESRFDDKPSVKAALHATLGWTYKKLGWPDRGEPHLAMALNLRERQPDTPPEELAQSFHELAAVNWDLSNYDRAASLYRRALDMRHELAAESGNSSAALLAVAETTNHLAACLDRLGERNEAERFYREALSIRRAHLPEDDLDVLFTLNNLATCLREQSKLDEAEHYFREVMERLPRDPSPALAGCMGNLGNCLMRAGEMDEAEDLLLSAVKMKRAVLGPDDRRLAISLHDLGDLYLKLDEPARAERLLAEALDIRLARFGEDDRRSAETGNLLGECLVRLDELEEAEPLLARSYPVLATSYGPDREIVQQALQRLIDVNDRLGRSDQAKAYRAMRPPR